MSAALPIERMKIHPFLSFFLSPQNKNGKKKETSACTTYYVLETSLFSTVSRVADGRGTIAVIECN